MDNGCRRRGGLSLDFYSDRLQHSFILFILLRAIPIPFNAALEQIHNTICISSIQKFDFNFCQSKAIQETQAGCPQET
eukprot:759951-Hanusia_phi.AAC.1